MTDQQPAAAVLGNVNLDVVCKPVDEVPRHHSLLYEESVILPGGNGSNTAIGLASRGVAVYLIAQTGADHTADLLHKHWERAGVDTRWVQAQLGTPTGTSVVLVDSAAQPRFIHTPGANGSLLPELLQPERLLERGVKHLHVAGYFVLPGLLQEEFSRRLAAARKKGLTISLDVVSTPGMSDPEPLWSCLPALDVFLCNQQEAEQLLGIGDVPTAARDFRARGARAVIIKLGENGCWVDSGEAARRIPAPQVDQIVDTTGAGDAFASGLIAGLLAGKQVHQAAREAVKAGSEVIGHLGAVPLDQVT
jgi:ribokinase